MYTTELKTDAQAGRDGPALVEDPKLLAAFEARVAADDFIEPKDWMPSNYRRTLIRQISQHACRLEPLLLRSNMFSDSFRFYPMNTTFLFR